MSAPNPITYASAGVDVEAGDRAVELMKDAVKATHTAGSMSTRSTAQGGSCPTPRREATQRRSSTTGQERRA